MILDKEVNNVFGFSPNASTYGGYLICDSCKGYYKLKNNESPDDFLKCECGGSLRYRRNIDNLLKVPRIPSIYNDSGIYSEIDEYDEYEELQQIVNFLRIKATERKRFLEDLCQRVMSQEEMLNKIKYGRYNELNSENESIWDILDKRTLNNKISGQKKVIDNSIENENRFLSLLHEKRSKPKSISEKLYAANLTKLSIIVLLIVAIIIISIYILI